MIYCPNKPPVDPSADEAGLPLLQTPRTYLHRFTGADRAAFFRLYGDPMVMRYFGGPLNPEQLEDRYRRVRDHYRLHGFGIEAIAGRTSHEILGRAGLQYLADSDELELSYALLPAHWGCGLASEVVAGLIECGLRRIGTPRIVALVHPENRASVRVLQKVGMVRGGTPPSNDLEMYWIDHPTWQRHRARQVAAAAASEARAGAAAQAATEPLKVLL